MPRHVLRMSRIGRRRLAPYAFLAPFLLMFGVFWAWPIAYSFWLSFTSWDGFGTPRPIGLGNYEALVADSTFHTAVANTVVAAGVYVVVLMILATSIGIVLGWFDVKVRVAFRTSLFLPVTMALVVSATVFSFIFARDHGLLNEILAVFGVAPRDWLGDESLALWSIVGMRIWRNVGYYAIFIVAGLQAIPWSLYEAARVDGASIPAIIRHVTLPLLRPMLLYVAVVASIHALQLFDEPWVMTQGGPGESTLTMVMYLYQNTFQFFQLGYGAAVSWVLILIILGFALVQSQLLRSQVE